MSKTLWIIDHYSSEPQHGGYTRQYNLAKGISKHDIRVVVIASSFSHFRHEYISEQECFISKVNNNMSYVYLRTDGYKNNVGLQRLKGMLSFHRKVLKHSKTIASTLGKPTWVVASSPHIFSWSTGERIAEQYKAEYNIEIRDFWPLELRTKNDTLLHKLLYKYFDYLETHCFKKAKHIICTMPYGYKYFTDYRKPGKDKFVFIGQPLDCDRFDYLAEKNKDRLPVKISAFIDNSFSCVFAGYYMKYEGVFEMLEAADQVRSAKFLFVGSGNEKSKMKEYVKEKRLDNVLITERIDKELIPALLKKSDVCLAYLHDDNNIEMFKYGLSKNKLNEYMYSGAVTVLGYDYNTNEINESNCGYTFIPDRNCFSEIIGSILAMTESERNCLGVNGREYIRQEHDIESLSKKYIEKILV